MLFRSQQSRGPASSNRRGVDNFSNNESIIGVAVLLLIVVPCCTRLYPYSICTCNLW